MTVNNLAAAIVLALISAVPATAAELIMIDSKACSYCAKFNREVTPAYGSTSAGQSAPLRKVSPYKKWPAESRKGHTLAIRSRVHLGP